MGKGVGGSDGAVVGKGVGMEVGRSEGSGVGKGVGKEEGRRVIMRGGGVGREGAAVGVTAVEGTDVGTIKRPLNEVGVGLKVIDVGLLSKLEPVIPQIVKMSVQQSFVNLHKSSHQHSPVNAPQEPTHVCNGESGELTLLEAVTVVAVVTVVRGACTQLVL